MRKGWDLALHRRHKASISSDRSCSFSQISCVTYAQPLEKCGLYMSSSHNPVLFVEILAAWWSCTTWTSLKHWVVFVIPRQSCIELWTATSQQSSHDQFCVCVGGGGGGQLLLLSLSLSLSLSLFSLSLSLSLSIYLSISSSAEVDLLVSLVIAAGERSDNVINVDGQPHTQWFRNRHACVGRWHQGKLCSV